MHLGNVLVTGATGFVGSAICQKLAAQGFDIVALMRQRSDLTECRVQTSPRPHIRFIHSDLVETTVPPLETADLVIHCAARVHQVPETVNDPLSEYRRVNRDATLLLAQAAAQEGFKRFIFLSSVKVNGEFSRPGQPFRSSEAAPLDPYGISKWEAEQGLREIAAKTGMEVVIIRPPLVYGPGVKANFLTMMRWLHRGLPLPLGAIHNRRSLVGLANLVDFIALCLTHPLAANQTFMISDQQDVSTTELLQGLGHALGRPARLVPIPSTWLQWGLQVVGKSGIAQRLCADLAVDSTAANALLGWKPPTSVEQGLQVTAEHFLAQIAAASKKPS